VPWRRLGRRFSLALPQAGFCISLRRPGIHGRADHRCRVFRQRSLSVAGGISWTLGAIWALLIALAQAAAKRSATAAWKRIHPDKPDPKAAKDAGKETEQPIAVTSRKPIQATYAFRDENGRWHGNPKRGYAGPPMEAPAFIPFSPAHRHNLLAGQTLLVLYGPVNEDDAVSVYTRRSGSPTAARSTFG
jgi:hypothetical protein